MLSDYKIEDISRIVEEGRISIRKRSREFTAFGKTKAKRGEIKFFNRPTKIFPGILNFYGIQRMSKLRRFSSRRSNVSINLKIKSTDEREEEEEEEEEKKWKLWFKLW